jgi:hypothetical protein
MLYVIITTCLFNDCEVRKQQYTDGIESIKNIFKLYNIDCKMIIVENHRKGSTFLDNFELPVTYTYNNHINVKDKGHKELQDILHVINNEKIKDDDFLIKFTGRYILKESSQFIKLLKEAIPDLKDKYDCIIRYGPYFDAVGSNKRVNDCVLALIGMKVKYIKRVISPIENNGCIEHNWARVTNLIDSEKIIIVDNLGVDMYPVADGGTRKYSV